MTATSTAMMFRSQLPHENGEASHCFNAYIIALQPWPCRIVALDLWVPNVFHHNRRLTAGNWKSLHFTFYFFLKNETFKAAIRKLNLNIAISVSNIQLQDTLHTCLK